MLTAGSKDFGARLATARGKGPQYKVKGTGERTIVYTWKISNREKADRLKFY